MYIYKTINIYVGLRFNSFLLLKLKILEMSSFFNEISKKYQSIFKNNDVSVVCEFIVNGYIGDKTSLFIPNIVLYHLCKYYGNVSLSNIINDKQWIQFIKMICNKLNKNNITFNKIFEAKINGFDADSFHNICDNKGPTLCIIKNNYNYIFGGYTSKSWNKPNGLSIYSSDKNAFLFGIHPKMFTMHINKDSTNQAIEQTDGYSIVFGDTGLFLDDECNNNGSWISTVFEWKGIPLVKDNQKHGIRCAFVVENYEVFQAK